MNNVSGRNSRLGCIGCLGLIAFLLVFLAIIGSCTHQAPPDVSEARPVVLGAAFVPGSASG